MDLIAPGMDISKLHTVVSACRAESSDHRGHVAGIEPGSPDSKADVLSIQPLPLLKNLRKSWEVILLYFESYSAKKLSKTK